MRNFENLFISDAERVHCNRFTSIVCRFIDDYLTAKLIDIPFDADLWLYVFTNEIIILYQIRYKTFIKPIVNDPKYKHLVKLIEPCDGNLLRHEKLSQVYEDEFGKTPSFSELMDLRKLYDKIFGDNSEYEQKASLIRLYRNKLLAHPEKQYISQLGLTQKQNEELNIILQDPVLLLHIYQYLHEDLYEKLRLSGSIGAKETFHMVHIKYTQDKYNAFKQKLLNKLNIGNDIFFERWNNAMESLNLYRLNNPESKKGRHYNFIFDIVSN